MATGRLGLGMAVGSCEVQYDGCAGGICAIKLRVVGSRFYFSYYFFQVRNFRQGEENEQHRGYMDRESLTLIAVIEKHHDKEMIFFSKLCRRQLFRRRGYSF